jgi:hypothetical protein
MSAHFASLDRPVKTDQTTFRHGHPRCARHLGTFLAGRNWLMTDPFALANKMSARLKCLAMEIKETPQ